MLASTVRPLAKITWRWPPFVAASAMTWLLVRMSPPVLMMIPEPVSPVTLPCCWNSAAMVTTTGSTLFATDCTLPAGALAVWLASRLLVQRAEPPASLVWPDTR